MVRDILDVRSARFKPLHWDPFEDFEAIEGASEYPEPARDIMADPVVREAFRKAANEKAERDKIERWVFSARAQILASAPSRKRV